MAARDDERSVELARRGVLVAGAIGFVAVVISIVALIGVFRPEADPSLVGGPVAAVEAAVPADEPAAPEQEAEAPPEQQVAAVQQAESMTTSDYDEMILPSLDWVPEQVPGASVVDFSITNMISDGGTETFGIADSFTGLRGLRGGETNSYKVREGELMLVQDTPSGWPDPQITCNNGDAWNHLSTVWLTLTIGPPVACTITNTRDADSLSVLDSQMTCDGITGRVQGPADPFVLIYQLIPVDTGQSFSPVELGAFRVDEQGPFFVPFWMLEREIDDGDYELAVITHDLSGSVISLRNATSFNPETCR